MRIHLTGAVWQADFMARLRHGFESLNHEVIFFDEARGGGLLKKIKMRLARKPYTVEDEYRKKASEAWIDSVKRAQPDLIILEHAVNIAPFAVEAVRSLKVPIVYWYTSPPHLLASKDILLAARHADVSATIDRRWMPFIQHFARSGKVHHLPLAGSPELFKPLEGVSKKYDVSFVGSFSPQFPDGLLRAYVVSELPETLRIGIFGNGAEYWASMFPRLKSLVATKGFVSNERLNEIYNQSEIVLNIHSMGHDTSISARTFDAALAGGFQLVDWREDLDQLFQAGTFISFTGVGQMQQKMSEWLPQSNERQQKAQAARSAVLEQHTWQHRAAEIIRLATQA